jgi:L-lyxonate dehydratase
MKITGIQTTLVRFPADRFKRMDSARFSVNPTHIFPDLHPLTGRPLSGSRAHMLVVEIETDAGLSGISSTNVAAEPITAIIQGWFNPLLAGADPMDTEALWERMFRATIPMGSSGLALMAISLVDIALWDIKGQAMGQPIYMLLGGKARPRLRAYASRLYGPDPAQLQEEAAGYAAEGYTAVKQRFAFGPADGVKGMRQNFEMVKAVREAIGPDVELMVDACRSFDADYAIRMIRMVEEFDPVWVEEPVLPHDIPGYAAVRRAVRPPIAGGEHEYTRYGFRQWLEKGAADILQPDVNRAGGFTEMLKINGLASSWGIPIIPHGGQMHNYHFIAATMNSPLAEYFPPSPGLADGNAFYWEIVEGEPQVVAGYLELPDTPGLGLKLNRAALERFRVGP